MAVDEGFQIKRRDVMDDGRATVIIVDDEPITRMDLREILEGKGYIVIEEANDGFDAILLCRKHHPDLVFMDVKMPLLDGMSASQIIMEEKLAGTIILLTAYTNQKYVEGAKKNGVGGYMVKPIVEGAIIPTIELAMARSNEVQQLRRDMEKVSERLKSRIVIEQAKGRLMQRGKIQEDDAYGYLRRVSQEKNVPIRRVAEYVLMQTGG